MHLHISEAFYFWACADECVSLRPAVAWSDAP